MVSPTRAPTGASLRSRPYEPNDVASVSAIHGTWPPRSASQSTPAAGDRDRHPHRAVQALAQDGDAEQHVHERVDEVAEAALEHVRRSSPPRCRRAS